MNLKEMIDNNIAVLDAESNHQEMLAEEKLQRQREAQIQDMLDSIVVAVIVPTSRFVGTTTEGCII